MQVGALPVLFMTNIPASGSRFEASIRKTLFQNQTNIEALEGCCRVGKTMDRQDIGGFMEFGVQRAKGFK